ncbi:MAG TPA: OmpA family protein [Steroidobacteraceae bacterium]|jgi:outer membrane protein OmpA-like peptidoglycan-associated protein|nr:OmpA family protein [Steroidobacteraceae bacterium]
MNTTNYPRNRSLIGAAVAAVLLTACASTPQAPAGSAAVRAKLTALQGDAVLGTRAPIAIKDAELAVAQAEIPQPDLVLAAHRVYIADRKVDTAKALAQTQFAEQERTALNQQSEKARLDSRTHEVDTANNAALTARLESAEQKVAAGNARSDADAAQLAANVSQQQAAELQRQLEVMQARPTDRGLVLTLGDTLFATGRAELKAGASANLDRLAEFMAQYPQRTAAIEGFTDSSGSEEYNQDLSQRRADSVKGYLVGRGVQTGRLSSSGRGENAPVGDNASASGRQQNRRVEVIISQPVSNKVSN